MIPPENNRTCKNILVMAFSGGFLRRLESVTGPEIVKDSKKIPDAR